MNRAGILALVAAGVVATGVGTYGYLGRPPTSPSKVGCDLTMTPHHTLTKGVSGTTQSLAFVSRACATGTVTVAHGGVTQGTCSLSSGSCTYSDTLPDMATTTVTGSITLNGVTHTDSLVATMDSANPEISLSFPALAGDGSLVVVSGVIDPTGIPLNLHLEAHDPGFYADALPGTDGGGHVTVIAVVLGGSDGGSLVTAWQGTQLAATALTVTPQTVTQSITLPEGAVGMLTLTASIGSGSTALAIPTMVDTLVPPTPITVWGVARGADGGACADPTYEACQPNGGRGPTPAYCYPKTNSVAVLPDAGCFAGGIEQFGTCHPSGPPYSLPCVSGFPMPQACIAAGSSCYGASYCTYGSVACPFPSGFTTDALLCAPCTSNSECGTQGVCGGGYCLPACGFDPPTDGSAYTHVVDQRHADLDLAVIIPPDAGPLWGNPTTGQIETEFGCINNTQISQNITAAVVYRDAGSAADIVYPDGGSGIDFQFAAQWMCSHHDAGCLVVWSPP